MQIPRCVTIAPGQTRASLNTGPLLPGAAQLEVSLDDPTCPGEILRFAVAVDPDPAFKPGPSQLWTVRLSD